MERHRPNFTPGLSADTNRRTRVCVVCNRERWLSAFYANPKQNGDACQRCREFLHEEGKLQRMLQRALDRQTAAQRDVSATQTKLTQLRQKWDRLTTPDHAPVTRYAA